VLCTNTQPSPVTPQTVLDRAAAFAASSGDEEYVQRAAQQRAVLVALRATAEAYLREYLRRIAAASRINAQSRRAWEMTPPVSLLLCRLFVI
jgi:hypothetical protein